MSAYVRVPTAMTDCSVLIEAIRQCGLTIQQSQSQIIISYVHAYGGQIVLEPSDQGFVAVGIGLRANQQLQDQMALVNSAYNKIIEERLRVAAEAERQRMLEERRKLVAEQTASLLAQAKKRNFRVKEELVDGRKRFTLVKMVVQ